MKLITNIGADRVIDELRKALAKGESLDVASPALSLFAFAKLRELLGKVGSTSRYGTGRKLRCSTKASARRHLPEQGR